MADKNIQMKQRVGSSWDNLFPITLNENVFDENGVSLPTKLNTLKTDINNQIDDDFNDFQTIINNQLQDMKSDVDDATGRLSHMRSITEYNVDPTGVTDSRQGFINAFNDLKDNEELILHPNARYRINGTIDYTTDKTISINGNGATFEFYLSNQSNGFQFNGRLKSTKTISGSILKGSDLITLNNTSGIEVDDLLYIKGGNQFASSRSYYKRGGTVTVKQVVSSTQLRISFQFPYQIIGGTVEVYDPVTIDFKNLNIKSMNALPSGDYGLHVNNGVNVSIDNVTTDNFNINVHLEHLYNTTINHLETKRSYWTGTTTSYGLALYGCTHTNIGNSIFNSGRHGLEISGFENSFKTFINNVYASGELGEALGFNMHQSSYDLIAINSTFKGVGLANNVTLINCSIYEGGALKSSDDPKYTNYRFTNCDFLDDTFQLRIIDDGQVSNHTCDKIGSLVIEQSTVYGRLQVDLSRDYKEFYFGTVEINKTNNANVTLNFETNIEQLIFRDYKFDLDAQILISPNANTYIDNILFDNMIIGMRYNVVNFNSQFNRFNIMNSQALNIGLNSPQMSITSKNSSGNGSGQLNVTNSDFTSLPITSGGLLRLMLVNSQLPIIGTASNIQNKQRTVMENI